MKLFLTLCFLVLFALQYKLWFMQDGVISCWQLKSSIAAKEKENARLLARNNQLFDEVQAWKTGSALIEAHARYDLGMVKQGEVFYRIVR